MQFKKLAIITDCVHLQAADGKTATDNPVFLRQMQALAAGFEETIICCPVVKHSNISQSSFYTNSSISFITFPNAGGKTVWSKWSIIKALPQWYKAFKKMNAWADVVYQRFPNNINIPGFFYFYYKKKPVFASYTGNWYNYSGEPFTYRLQKKLLKKWFRGPVGIYFEDQKHAHVFKTFSPSYTVQDWHNEAPFAEAKKQRWQSAIVHTPVFISVGILTHKKNQQFILDAFLQLKKEGISFRLYIVGDGILRASYERFVQQNGLSDCVFITGKQDYEALKTLYRQADFLVHASLVEGYVKVPVEGFFHGVIPIINNISIASEMIGNNERGYVFSVQQKERFIELIKSLLHNSNELPCKIEKGRQYAYERTMEQWQQQFMKSIETFDYSQAPKIN